MSERDELRRQVKTLLDHDIRGPLSALIGHTELLREVVEDLPQEVAESLGAIERSGWKLNEMIRSLAEKLEELDKLDRGGR